MPQSPITIVREDRDENCPHRRTAGKARRQSRSARPGRAQSKEEAMKPSAERAIREAMKRSRPPGERKFDASVLAGGFAGSDRIEDALPKVRPKSKK